MMSARPATAPPGRPPATILASTHMSGVMPKRACAPPRDQRKPVITSSKIRTTPCAARQLAQLGEEALGQRHLAPRGARRLEDDGGDVVARRERGGDAADVVGRQQDGLLDQVGRNARRHAALEVRHGAGSTPSCQPWKWPTKRITFGLPVKARASRSARCEASVPEAVKRTRSAQGIRRLTSSAHRTSSSCEAPQCVPSFTWRSIASTTAGCPWPSSSAPWPPK